MYLSSVIQTFQARELLMKIVMVLEQSLKCHLPWNAAFSHLRLNLLEIPNMTMF